MKHSKSLIFAVVLALSGLFCSCEEKVSKSYYPELEISFVTTQDVATYTIRQFEVYKNGELISSYTISGAEYDNKLVLGAVTPPANYQIKVFGTANGSAMPESMSVLNTYKIKMTLDNGFAVYENTESTPHTIQQSAISNYITKNLNYTVSFKINEDGTLSKVE